MLTRLSIEVDPNELYELRQALEKMTKPVSSVEIGLNPKLRSICRFIITEIDRWEDFKKERW
jgi:hypothetical protein